MNRKTFCTKIIIGLTLASFPFFIKPQPKFGFLEANNKNLNMGEWHLYDMKEKIFLSNTLSIKSADDKNGWYELNRCLNKIKNPNIRIIYRPKGLAISEYKKYQLQFC